MAGAGTTSVNARHPDQVAISIREKLQRLPQPSDCCIFTVPEKLRRSNEEAYTPRVVAIGPYHRGKQSLKPMEDHKLLYLREFLEDDVLYLQNFALRNFLDEFRDPDDLLKDDDFLEADDRCEDEDRPKADEDRPEADDRREDEDLPEAEDRPEADDRPKADDRSEDDDRPEADDRLEYYIESVKSWEDEARRCYDRPIHLNSNEFAEMMLLDGIFVIQLFLLVNGRRATLSNDKIFDQPWMLNDVCRDMTLLENQIPFFVIWRLFKMAFTTYQGYQPVKLLELMHNFFHWSMLMENKLETGMELKVKHIVDASRFSYLLSTSEAPHEGTEDIKLNPSATELTAAGVKLKRGKSERLFDIKFENGELQIPCLILDDRKEYFFRNIIAFEQCYHRSGTNLLSYIAFMDHLIDTPADTKLLIDEGIIENWLSDIEAATNLINALCKEISMSTQNQHYSELSDKLIKHCQRPYNKWKATLKREYCSNPWVVISVIAAVVLLLLTVIQAVCSVLSLA